jgi:hypothetical protein
MQRHQLIDRARAANAEWVDKPIALQSIWYLFFDGWLTYVWEGLERSAARAGLEHRSPFCDRRVIEFMCGLAEEQRWNQGVPRLLMRHAMRGLLPERIRTRTTKAFFDNTIVRVVRNVGDSMIDQLIVEKMGWVSASQLREAHDSASRLYQARDSKYGDYMWTVFAAFGVETFLRSLTRLPAASTQTIKPPLSEVPATCL